MNIFLIYDGKAFEDKEMEACDLASALFGFDGIFKTANSVLNQERAKANVKIKADFQSGSFKINLNVCVDYVEQVKNLLLSDNITSVTNAQGLIGIICALIGLVKFLKGRRPQKIYENSDGTFTINRADNKTMNVMKEVKQLYENYELRKCFENLTSPLEKEGVEKLVIKREKDLKNDYSIILKEERDYFRAIPRHEEKLDEEEYRITVKINQLVFKSKKMQVDDGDSVFWLTIEDEKFLKDIDTNKIAFSKDDLYKFLIRREQYFCTNENKIVCKHYAKEFIEQKKAPQQLSFM